MGKLRLDKWLADMGVGTRSEVKRAIIKGQVSVDGVIIKRPETKIDTAQSKVAFMGQDVGYVRYEYYMLYKPAGVVSATKDKKDKCVVEFIESPRRKDLFPVGRLDKDTEGLLLVTNDGALAHKLLAPSRHVDKVYHAQVSGKLTEADVNRFEEGLDIGDEKRTMPARLVIIKSGELSEAEVTIQEGRFHQVKRMFRAVGKEVVYLKRLSMGRLTLDPSLEPGSYRELTKEEIDKLC